MSQVSRRNFMKSSLAAGAAAVMAGPLSKVRGANDDVRVAVVGLNGRGASHISAYNGLDGVRVVALCDVDANVLERRAKPFKDKGKKVATYDDIRKMLDDKSIDAISIATPNHWHSLATVWGCQAGKDVYVEKPCSHVVFEGRQAVEASRKYDRIVQHGTQSRASSGWHKQIAAVQSGKYGKLLVSKGYCCKPRWSIGYKNYKMPPDNLDFNIWLGPALEQAYHENLVHYNWHWFWDFGNGDIGNQGVHQMDIARWAIGGDRLPNSVVSMGGRYVDGENFTDQGQTPNQQLCVYDFGDCLLVFETRGLVGKYKDFPRKVDNEFYLEAGAIKGGKFYPKGSNKAEPLVDVPFKMNAGDNFGNFINAVRSRKREQQHAEILQGHLSSALCHLGNISYRMGHAVPFDTKPADFMGNGLVSDAMMTVLENTKAIGIDPAKTTYALGPKLKFDPKKERFIDNPGADMLLSRAYRAPFVVPEKV